MRKTLVFFFIFLLPLSASAKNLYVDVSTGNDSTTYANNDSEHPWASLLRATWGRSDGDRTSAGISAAAAQAGDTVYVAAGTYEYDHSSYLYSSGSDPLYNPVNSGSSGNWIKFEAVGTVNLTTNYVPTGTWYRQSECAPILGVAGGGGTDRYIWWDGFTINQQSICYRRGHGVVEISADNFKITNCTIAGTDTDYGEADQHNAILLVGGDGTSTCTSDVVNDITISNNTLSGFIGTNHNDSGITTYCLGDNITIEHNEFIGNDSGIYGKSSYDESANIFIRYNLFADQIGDAIRMQAYDSWWIYQNVFRDNAKAVLHLDCTSWATLGTHPSDTRLVNNTSDNNKYLIYFDSDCENLVSNYVRNNITTNLVTAALNSEGEDCISAANIGTDDIDFDYNVYEYPGNFWVVDGVGSNAATVAAFYSGFGQDQHSADDVDPLYTNESSNDFTLQAESPCREGGANDGVDILDLDGDSSTVDAITLGAYITGLEEIGIESGSGSGLPVSMGCKPLLP